jgi:hypothetical protein
MGFSEEVVTEVVQSLADLYIASDIYYEIGGKFPNTERRRTRYWIYNELTDKILRQFNLISGFAIYSKYVNHYFINLNKKNERGLLIAREAFENRLQNNLSFVNELIKKYKYLLPILYYGASYDNTLKRFYFCYNCKTDILNLSTDYGFMIRTKTGWNSHELWANIRSMAFQSIASTKVMRDAINEFFTQLYEKRLVLLMPSFSSSRVYEEERWIVTDELLNIMKEKITEKQIEKLKGIIRDYVTMLLLYLGEEGYTKGQISSIIGMIVDENKDLNISHYELEDEFYKMVNKISSLTGSISKFNEAGGPESRPFLILNYNELDNTIKTLLEDLGSKTISSLMNQES